MAVDVKQHQTLLTFSRRYRMPPQTDRVDREWRAFLYRSVLSRRGGTQKVICLLEHVRREALVSCGTLSAARIRGLVLSDLQSMQRSKKVPAHGEMASACLIPRKRAGSIRFVRGYP